jgi:hypothetical protein
MVEFFLSLILGLGGSVPQVTPGGGCIDAGRCLASPQNGGTIIVENKP